VVDFKHSGTFQNGTFCFDNPLVFRGDCLSRDGRRGYLLVKNETKRKKRSNQQNRFYWGVIVKMISDETGNSVDETHGYLGLKFRIMRDKKLPYVRSTTDLSTVEFEEHNEEIRRWAVEFLNLNIPLPNEIDYSEIMEMV